MKTYFIIGQNKSCQARNKKEAAKILGCKISQIGIYKPKKDYSYDCHCGGGPGCIYHE